MMKKTICTLVGGLLLAATLTTPAFANAALPQVPSETSGADEAVVYADQFITYHRIYNGVNQYRIWNASKGVWVTNWINC